MKNLAVFLVKKAVCRSLDDKVRSMTNDEVRRIARLIKSFELEVTGCSPWQNAQVTMGGILSECVNDKLEVKRFRGMYLCGEILDVAGDCGGYNLQWAWSSGIWAGRNCALSLKG